MAQPDIALTQPDVALAQQTSTGPARGMLSYGRCLQLDMLNTAGHTAMAYDVSVSPSPPGLDLWSLDFDLGLTLSSSFK